MRLLLIGVGGQLGLGLKKLFSQKGPRSYDHTKLAGEESVEAPVQPLIRRAFRRVYSRGHKFVGTTLRLGKERDVFKVKDDELVSPTGGVLFNSCSPELYHWHEALTGYLKGKSLFQSENA